MPLFVLSCLDKPDSVPLRMATRPAHAEYMGGKGEMVRMGGPYLNDKGEMVGTLFILEAADRAEVQAFTDNDPYTLAGLFQSVEIRPWMLVKSSL